MKTHLKKYHPSVRDIDALKTYTISESEKAALKLRWDKRHKVKPRRKHNVASAPLAISEVHSSRQALT